jgi:hypothetical protein
MDQIKNENDYESFKCTKLEAQKPELQSSRRAEIELKRSAVHSLCSLIGWHLFGLFSRDS